MGSGVEVTTATLHSHVAMAQPEPAVQHPDQSQRCQQTHQHAPEAGAAADAGSNTKRCHMWLYEAAAGKPDGDG